MSNIGDADAPTRSLVVGTAGHIDHGKSTLVRALTGTDPDRLQEEKERGITIDLGFAFMSLPDQTRLMFVDVPGHERFVKNMLAGAGGIDAALLVVAADESVMPQTREHLDILKLLRVPQGLVVITKADLVDDDLLAVVEEEIRELTVDSFLAEAPSLTVDAKSGRGLPELTDALTRLSSSVPPRASDRLFRLPVDRVFAMKGFGTVVTGTAMGGTLEVGSRVRIHPTGGESRVRSIEVAGSSSQRARSGERTALNLPDFEVQDLDRGAVVAPPGALHTTRVLYAELEVLPSSPTAVADRSRVRLHLGAAELMARVRVLEASSGDPAVAPGASGFVKLQLESPACAHWGDRFVVRRYSPIVTIAGGRVLHPVELAGRAARSIPRLLPLLHTLQSGNLADAAVALIEHAGLAGAGTGDLSPLLGHPEPTLASALAPSVEDGRLTATEQGRYLSRSALAQAEERIVEELKRHHHAAPLEPGVSREHLRNSLFPHTPPDVYRHLLQALERGGAIASEGEFLRLSSFSVQTSAEQNRALAQLEEQFRNAGVNPPTRDEAARRAGVAPEGSDALIDLLVRRGVLRKVGSSLLFHARTIDDICTKLQALLPGQETIGVPEFKDLVGTSRKYAIPLLEYLDAQRITERRGDVRRIRPPR